MYVTLFFDGGVSELMLSKSNKHLMHRFMELMNSASPDQALATDLISPSALFHVPGRPTALLGPTGYLTVLQLLRSGFPDIQWTLEDLVVEETRAAARFTVRGTHLGPFLGVAATGKTIDLKSIGFYRLVGGQVLEEYVQPDLATYLRVINPAAGRRRAPRVGIQEAICRNRSSLAFRYARES